jgi:hypothetical protein
MKKFVLSIGAVALIALAAVNVSIALQSEKDAKWNVASQFSLAQNENGGGSGTGENGGGTLWTRTDGDCVYTFTGKVGAKITIFGGTIITIGADGTATYTYGGGKTDCTSGGSQQCSARYCPPLTGS